MKDDVQHDHPKVQELRELSKWSDGHVWVSPEQHGNLVSYPAHADFGTSTNKFLRQPCSKTRSTGSPYPPAPCDPHKAEL